MKLGIDIGGSHVGMALIDDNFEIVSKKEIDLPENKSNMGDYLVRIVRDTVLNVREKFSLVGICSPRDY